MKLKKIFFIASILIGFGAFFYFQLNNNLTKNNQSIKQQEEDLTPKTQSTDGSLAGRLLSQEQKNNNFDLNKLTLKENFKNNPKIKILNEIFISKNDNDPRLDSDDFRNLSREDKKALIAFYESLPKEARNEKGTIVFLIGRSLSETFDFDFLKNVLSEKPCLGLENCAVEIKSSDEHHHDVGLDITLNYPQIVAIQSLINKLEQDPNNQTLKNNAKELINIAIQTGVPAIISKAKELETRL
jgi:hypothetical protein